MLSVALCAALLAPGMSPEEEVEAWQPPQPPRASSTDAVPYEVGVGATFGTNLIANMDVLSLGPGLGAALRGGRDLLFSAALDVAPWPVFSVSPRFTGLARGSLNMPFAALAVGVGWRFLREDGFEAGLGAAPFVGVGPYSCGDCIVMAPAVGVSPNAFVTWGARDGVRVTIRTQAPTGVTLGGGAFFAGFITLEPTFSWQR